MYAVANSAAVAKNPANQRGLTVMIFTRRFGALAARRVFPHVTETDQEQTPDLPLTDTETDHVAEPSAA